MKNSVVIISQIGHHGVFFYYELTSFHRTDVLRNNIAAITQWSVRLFYQLFQIDIYSFAISISYIHKPVAFQNFTVDSGLHVCSGCFKLV